MRGDPLNVGDRITWSEYFHHGECYYRDVLDMPQKCHGLRKYGHDRADEDPHFVGGFAEYCYILPGTWILKLPDELSDEEATPLNCGVATMASVTEAADGALRLSPARPEVSRQMEVAQGIMRRYRHTLRELAK